MDIFVAEIVGTIILILLGDGVVDNVVLSKSKAEGGGWNMITALIGTTMLLIGVLGIFKANNGIGSGIGPYAVGILVFAIGLSLGGPTGYAINPARDLGPRIAHFVLSIPGKRDSDWGYSWVPIVGPAISGALGALLYQFVFFPFWP